MRAITKPPIPTPNAIATMSPETVRWLSRTMQTGFPAVSVEQILPAAQVDTAVSVEVQLTVDEPLVVMVEQTFVDTIVVVEHTSVEDVELAVVVVDEEELELVVLVLRVEDVPLELELLEDVDESEVVVTEVLAGEVVELVSDFVVDFVFDSDVDFELVESALLLKSPFSASSYIPHSCTNHFAPMDASVKSQPPEKKHNSILSSWSRSMRLRHVETAALSPQDVREARSLMFSCMHLFLVAETTAAEPANNSSKNERMVQIG